MEKMYHIGLNSDDIKGAKLAITTGDPGRVEKIASKLDEPIFLISNREYTSYLGKINNEYVLIISSGMGGPSMAICVEELSQIGIKTIIRVGTCGGMDLNVKAGDIVIAQGAIRSEGTSKEYVPIEYPALADLDVTNALRKAAGDLHLNNHVGVVHSKDSFYGQHDPARMPIGYELQNKWNAWIKAGALASEMETAALFTVASSLRIKAGSVLLAVWNQERESVGLDQNEFHDTNRVIDVAIKATSKLLK